MKHAKTGGTKHGKCGPPIHVDGGGTFRGPDRALWRKSGTAGTASFAWKTKFIALIWFLVNSEPCSETCFLKGNLNLLTLGVGSGATLLQDPKNMKEFVHRVVTWIGNDSILWTITRCSKN